MKSIKRWGGGGTSHGFSLASVLTLVLISFMVIGGCGGGGGEREFSKYYRS